MMDELINAISKELPVPPEVRDILKEYFTVEVFPRHHMLIKPGQVARKLYFLSDGFAHLFHEVEGERKTLAFAGKQEFLTAFKSFVYQRPSKTGIELLAQSRILWISREKLDELCVKHVLINKLYMLVLQEHAVRQGQRIKPYKSMSAPERLELLLREYPNIFFLTSKRQIATYLGISAATLSRIGPQFSDLINIKPPTANNTEICVAEEASMSTERFISYLSLFKPISKEHQQYLEKETAFQEYRKGQILSAPGEISTKEWFILRGSIKEYTYDKDGKIQVTNFWMEDELLRDPESFIQQIPATKYLECMEDTSVLILTRTQVDYLFKTFPESNAIANAILLKDKKKADAKHRFRGLSAVEKYQQFCLLFPKHPFSGKDSASFLEMTPSTFSKARAKVNKQSSKES